MTTRRLIRQSFSVLVVLSALATPNAIAQTQVLGTNQGKQPILVKKVFVNVTGDPKLAHRLLTFIDLELEDASFLAATTEADADAEIDADVVVQVETTNLGLGLSKWSTTAEGKTNTLTSCESLSSSEEGEFFGGSAEKLVAGLRERYPTAKTLEFDPSSDTTGSKVFGYELSNFLKTSGFEVVNSGKAAVSLHVNLVRLKVPVEERLVKYKWALTLKDGSRPSFSNGTGILSARASNPPAFCPDRVENLDWLAGGDPLFRESQSLIRQLRAMRKMATNKVMPR